MALRPGPLTGKDQNIRFHNTDLNETRPRNKKYLFTVHFFILHTFFYQPGFFVQGFQQHRLGFIVIVRPVFQ